MDNISPVSTYVFRLVILSIQQGITNRLVWIKDVREKKVEVGNRRNYLFNKSILILTMFINFFEWLPMNKKQKLAGVENNFAGQVYRYFKFETTVNHCICKPIISNY